MRMHTIIVANRRLSDRRIGVNIEGSQLEDDLELYRCRRSRELAIRLASQVHIRHFLKLLDVTWSTELS